MMDAYPATQQYITPEKLSPPAIVRRLSAEELKPNSPLERMLVAQNPLSTTNVPCIVNGQSVDNCVDLIYQRAKSADEVYPRAKVTPRHTKFATRYKALESNGKNWVKYFFNMGEISKKTQDIFRQDQKVNFEAFYKLHVVLRDSIEKVGLFREGFMVIGVSDKDIGGYIIPISPETVDKLKSL